MNKADDAPVPKQKPASKSSTKTVQEIETLNPSASAPTPVASTSSADSDDEEAPVLTPVMKAFASLPTALRSIPLSTDKFMPGFNPAKQLDLEAFEKAFDYLSSHKELLRPDYGASDALLMQAFESQMAGQKSLARMCTEKVLLIQYCNQLGRDGVSLFFQRYVTVVSNSSMMNTDGRAALVFLNDVLATYTRIASRADSMRDKFQEESGEGVEQIQLMSEDPNTVISFSIPDGPPPEHIKLEGEGTENLDVEQVREWLQQRWDIYSSFDDEFRRALESKSLEKVNEVLGRMPVSKAEVVVQDLDRAGILNFSSTEVRTAMTWSTYPTGSRRNKLNVSRHRLCSIHSSKYSHVIYTFTRGVAGVASYALPSIIPLRQH